MADIDHKALAALILGDCEAIEVFTRRPAAIPLEGRSFREASLARTPDMRVEIAALVRDPEEALTEEAR